MKILIFKLGALGDVAMTLPLAGFIKSMLPGAHITWVGGLGLKDLLSNHPSIDRLILVDDKKLLREGAFARVVEIFKLYWALKSFFSIAFVPYRALQYSILIRPLILGRIFSFARRSNKFRERFFGPCLVVPPMFLHEEIAVRKLGELAFGVALPSQWKHDFSYLTSNPHLPEPPSIIVHIGGGSNTLTNFSLKRWPHFNQLCLMLVREFSSYNLIIIGNHDDQADILAVMKFLYDSYPQISLNEPKILIGKRIDYLVDTISKASLFIGIDSGPVHIADSLNIRTIGIYGPTSVVSWGLIGSRSIALSINSHCSPCYKDNGFWPSCQNNRVCMNELSAEHVTNVARKLIATP